MLIQPPDWFTIKSLEKKPHNAKYNLPTSYFLNVVKKAIVCQSWLPSDLGFVRVVCCVSILCKAVLQSWSCQVYLLQELRLFMWCS